MGTVTGFEPVASRVEVDNPVPSAHHWARVGQDSALSRLSYTVQIVQAGKDRAGKPLLQAPFRVLAGADNPVGP